MAQTPGYDANNTSNVARYAPACANRAVTDTYEPGSTFKLVTITAALSDEIVTPTHALHAALPLPVRLLLAVHRARCRVPRATVNYSVAQILSYSSNVGAVTIAEKLGPQRLADWVKRFGFGSPTGIDFPGESPGFVAAARPVERHDDRQRADRPGHLGDADPDGVGVRGGRERRRLDPAAPRRARRRPRARARWKRRG